MTPTYHCQSPTGDKPYPLHRGNLLLSYISPSTWGNQRRARSHYHLSHIKKISGAFTRDSNLQDRGVAHYLLSLLFSLVSLPFSFCLCVLYKKTQKIVCLVTCLPPMPKFFETISYWHGGLTKDQQEWYKEYRLSQKGIHSWKQIHQLYEYARN